MMVRAALLAVVVTAAVPQTLSHRPAPGPPRTVEGDFSYDLEVTGPDTLVKQLIASNAVLSVQQVRATRKGSMVSTPGVGNTNHVVMTFENAKVTGIASGKPFKFDFQRTKPPSGDVKTDPARIVSFGLTMGRRNHLIGPTGDFRLADANKDAQAEASAIILDAPVHFPAKAVQVGETWNSEWMGKKQADNGASFSYKQTARLESLTEGNAPRATISYTTTAVFEIPADKNPQGEATTLEGKGTVVFDVNTGLVLSSDASGAITTEIKKSGVKLVRRMAAKTKTS